MTTAAANIQEAIDYCAANVGQLTFDGAVSIDTRMGTWISTVFTGSAAIFASPESANERTVSDWRIYSDMAKAKIEGAGAGQCGLVGCSAVIDAVTRVLFATRDAAQAGRITTTQRDAVVAAFNTNWT